MSIILSYINKNYVAIAADKRETTKYFFGNLEHRDDIVKVHKRNGVVFALCGHTEYINYFMDNLPDYNSVADFKSYVAKKVNEIQDMRLNNNAMLGKLKFDLHYGYVVNDRPVLHVYFLRPNDPDILFADVPFDFKQAAASWPDLENPDLYEVEVATNYPSNIIEVERQASDIIMRVSNESEYVSESLDLEYIVFNN